MSKLIQQTALNRLSKKLNPDVSKLFNQGILWKEYQNELQLAIDTYNNLKKSENGNLEILTNAKHLFNIWQKDLPAYEVVIDWLSKDSVLMNIVFHELAESDYFQVVWEIDNPNYLLINLMILFYRTTILHKFPQLRTDKAQISSTLEEMAAVLKLEGIDTELFSAVKLWLNSWEEEGFSEALYLKLKALEAL